MALLDEFTEFLRRRRRAAVTIRKRRAVVARLLTELDPYTVTLFELDEWVHTHWTADESLNASISGLRGFFRWMHASGRRRDNPALELETVAVQRRPARIAADAEIRTGIDLSADPATEAMIRLGAECGLRRHEIAKVHQDDVESGEWLHVIGKNRKHRVVHLPIELRELFPKLGEGYLFPGRSDGHLHPNTVYERIRRTVGANPHSLRHRAGTVVYEGTGNNLLVTQEFLGHSSPEMTARYVHTTRRDLLRAGDAARLGATDAGRHESIAA